MHELPVARIAKHRYGEVQNEQRRRNSEDSIRELLDPSGRHGSVLQRKGVPNLVNRRIETDAVAQRKIEHEDTVDRVGD